MAGVNRSSQKQRGISLLEVLLSLSIIAIILVMATRYFFVASNNDKINTTVSQIGGMIAAAHSWKGADPNYSNIGVSALSDAGQLTNFPGYTTNGDKGATLSTMWGDDITISAAGNFAQLAVGLPSNGICETIKKAYPADDNANITSVCTSGGGASKSSSKFTYTFP